MQSYDEYLVIKLLKVNIDPCGLNYYDHTIKKIIIIIIIVSYGHRNRREEVRLIHWIYTW